METSTDGASIKASCIGWVVVGEGRVAAISVKCSDPIYKIEYKLNDHIYFKPGDTVLVNCGGIFKYSYKSDIHPSTNAIRDVPDAFISVSRFPPIE